MDISGDPWPCLCEHGSFGMHCAYLYGRNMPMCIRHVPWRTSMIYDSTLVSVDHHKQCGLHQTHYASW